jgi:hypothetical protein
MKSSEESSERTDSPREEEQSALYRAHVIGHLSSSRVFWIKAENPPSMVVKVGSIE